MHTYSGLSLGTAGVRHNKLNKQGYRQFQVRAGKASLAMTKRSRSRKSLARVHGFRKRMQTPGGRKVLKRRRAKGRKVLCPKSHQSSGKKRVKWEINRLAPLIPYFCLFCHSVISDYTVSVDLLVVLFCRRGTSQNAEIKISNGLKEVPKINSVSFWYLSFEHLVIYIINVWFSWNVVW
jgi:ribosomal protein L34